MNGSDLVKSRMMRVALMTTAFLIVLVLVSLVLPAKWRVEREMDIATPPAMVFPYINNLKKWREWTVWYEADPDLHTEYSGPDAGLGATSRWEQGNHRGALKIMRSDTNRLVEYLLIFDGGAWEMRGAVRLTPKSDGRTQVEWRVGSEAGDNLLLRYVALVVKWRVERDLEQSLERLRAVLETQGKATVPVK